MVTERMRPLRIEGKTTHVVGFPYHFGPDGVVTGDIVNDLIAVGLDPNVKIHESKAFTCNIRKGMKTTGTPSSEERQPHLAVPEGGAVGRTHSEGDEMRREREGGVNAAGALVSALATEQREAEREAPDSDARDERPIRADRHLTGRRLSGRKK